MNYCPQCNINYNTSVCPTCSNIPQTDSSIDNAIFRELQFAMRKFPQWPTDPLHAMGVVNEEVGELNKAVLQQVYEPHKNPTDAVRKEAVQAAAMLLRFIASLDAYHYAPCHQHAQELE